MAGLNRHCCKHSTAFSSSPIPTPRTSLISDGTPSAPTVNERVTSPSSFVSRASFVYCNSTLWMSLGSVVWEISCERKETTAISSRIANFMWFSLPIILHYAALSNPPFGGFHSKRAPPAHASFRTSSVAAAVGDHTKTNFIHFTPSTTSRPSPLPAQNPHGTSITERQNHGRHFNLR